MAADQLAGGADLRQAQIKEGLSPEPRLDGHHQDHVQLGQQFGVGLDGRRRLEGHARPRAAAPQLAGESHGRVRRLDVEGHIGRAGLGVLAAPRGPGFRS